MGVATPFYAEECCYLVSENEASARRQCGGVPPVPDL